MKGGEVFLHFDRMLDASIAACSFVEELSEADFLVDSRTQSAVAMQLLIIGEAANRLKQDFPDIRARYPELAWSDMVGMRNRIAHGYFDLDFRAVWRTTTTDVPELLKQLKAIYAAAGEPIVARPTKKPDSN